MVDSGGVVQAVLMCDTEDEKEACTKNPSRRCDEKSKVCEFAGRDGARQPVTVRRADDECHPVKRKCRDGWTCNEESGICEQDNLSTYTPRRVTRGSYPCEDSEHCNKLGMDACMRGECVRTPKYNPREEERPVVTVSRACGSCQDSGCGCASGYNCNSKGECCSGSGVCRPVS